MPLITKDGLAKDPIENFVDINSVSELAQSGKLSIELSNDSDPERIRNHFDRIDTIRIPFPKTSDGRGFSLAKQLRNLGFKGRLRANGALISDQFRYALDCGFDEVEVDESIAMRQPAEHWQQQTYYRYQDKLRQGLSRGSPASNWYTPEVLEVEHYSSELFRFTTTRPDSFRFNAGEFAMIGLEQANKPLFRAYSLCSASYEDHLEFYSIKVPEGQFTRQLQWIKPGDSVLLKKKTTGSVVQDAILPGSRLFLHATGTGIAPFISLIQEPSLYQRFDQIILTQTCRLIQDLTYANTMIQRVKHESLVSEEASHQLLYLATTTQQQSEYTGRITTLIENQQLFDWLNIDTFNPDTDRVMICGSISFNHDLKDHLSKLGFSLGSLSNPGTMTWERAFVS